MELEPMTPEEIANDRTHWTPWWMWLLFALWILGTVTAVLWSLFPRYSLYTKFGRWIWKGVEVQLRKMGVDVGRKDEADEEGHGAAAQVVTSTIEKRGEASGVSGRKSEEKGSSKGMGVLEKEVGEGIGGSARETKDGFEMGGPASVALTTRSERGTRRNLGDSGWRRIE